MDTTSPPPILPCWPATTNPAINGTVETVLRQSQPCVEEDNNDHLKYDSSSIHHQAIKFIVATTNSSSSIVAAVGTPAFYLSYPDHMLPHKKRRVLRLLS
ncbi:hypothetical protein Dimus_001726 [Dionaea muscipula]